MLRNKPSIWFLGLCFGATSTFGQPSVDITGALEGGVNISLPGPPASKFLVDYALLNFTGNVSAKTRVVLNSALAVASGSGHSEFDARIYWGSSLITGGGLTLANTGAHVTHDWTDNIQMSVGFAVIPFGMEFMSSRFNQHSYYYSSTIAMASRLGWMYDLGISGKFLKLIPGTLEVVFLDGRQILGEDIPAAAARWHKVLKSGEMTITPVLSFYLGGLPPAPDPIDDGGFTVGAKWEMGKFWANTEFLMMVQDEYGVRYRSRSLVLEPGVTLGWDLNVSAKLDLMQVKAGAASAISDENLGFAISKTVDDFRIKVTCLWGNLSKRLPAGQMMDFRILFGTAW